MSAGDLAAAAAAESQIILKAPSGTSPDAICRKVVYWVQRRRLLFDQAREALGDLMFSKTTDDVQQALILAANANATAADGGGDHLRREMLEALLENNAKLHLNLCDRIVCVRARARGYRCFCCSAVVALLCRRAGEQPLASSRD